VEGKVIGSLVLLLGGTSVAISMLLYSGNDGESKSSVWKVSDGFESWLYGGGGVIAALLGAAILFDHFA